MSRFAGKALRNPYFMLGASMIALLLTMTVAGLVKTPYPPNYMDLSAASQGPSAAHWFGADSLGRDIFSRVQVAGRTAFATGLFSTAVSLFIGSALGLVSGFSGSAVDAALTKAIDVMRCIPSILFAMMIIAVLGAGLVNTIAAICFITIPNFFRVTRGSAIQVRPREYVVWTELAGIGRLRTMLLHVLPNILSPIIVTASMSVASAVLTEASLSYLGLGVQPPDPSWGQMLSDAQSNILRSPWEAVSVGLCISVMVLGFNLLGDGLRDVLDVRSI